MYNCRLLKKKKIFMLFVKLKTSCDGVDVEDDDELLLIGKD